VGIGALTSRPFAAKLTREIIPEPAGVAEDRSVVSAKPNVKGALLTGVFCSNGSKWYKWRFITCGPRIKVTCDGFFFRWKKVHVS
jgi:hypothetical protein